MALLPIYEVGLWNAWLLHLPELVFWPVGSWLLQRRAAPRRTPRREGPHRGLMRFLTGLILGAYAYSLVLPLAPSSVWFSGGLVLYAVGVGMESLALHAFAGTPVDQPVTTGIYGVSRHPMYLGEVMKRIGTGLACASWLYLALAIGEGLLWRRLAVFEEQDCVEVYGGAYQAYQTQVPQWVGRPTSTAATSGPRLEDPTPPSATAAQGHPTQASRAPRDRGPHGDRRFISRETKDVGNAHRNEV